VSAVIDVRVLERKFGATYRGERGMALEDIGKLALEILVAEKMLEEALKKEKDEERRRALQKQLERVKKLRDSVVTLYTYRLFGYAPP